MGCHGVAATSYLFRQLEELQLELAAYCHLVLLCLGEDGLYAFHDCREGVTASNILLSSSVPCASKASTIACTASGTALCSTLLACVTVCTLHDLFSAFSSSSITGASLAARFRPIMCWVWARRWM